MAEVPTVYSLQTGAYVESSSTAGGRTPVVGEYNSTVTESGNSEVITCHL